MRRTTKLPSFYFRLKLIIAPANTLLKQVATFPRNIVCRCEESTAAAFNYHHIMKELIAVLEGVLQLKDGRFPFSYSAGSTAEVVKQK